MSENHTVVVTGIVVHNGKFLVLKRKESEKIHGGKWSFPGGKVKKGEEVIEALAREVFEETGLLITGEKRFVRDFVYPRPDGSSTLGLCFVVEAKNDRVVLGRDFSEFKWVTREEFEDLDYIESLGEEVRLAFPVLD